MASWQHRLRDIDPETRTAVCTLCGPTRIKSNGRKNSQKWRCLGARSKTPYGRFKKVNCERCGFVAVHPRQLDVHHRDRNRKNNDLDNLETLCANCHRLEHVVD